MKGRVIKVLTRDGEQARRRLASLGWLDTDRRPAVEGEHLFLPIRQDAPRGLDLGVALEEGEMELEAREPRPRSLREAPGLPQDLADEVTRAMDIVGDIAVLKLDEALMPRAGEIGRALLEAQPRLRAVAVDQGVKGELRVRALTLVAGEGPLTTLHREHGATLEVDLASAYFSPRLATEHRRVADLVSPGERVLDMFAGVGPFAVLVAKLARPSEVHAIDLNPRAVELARANAGRNGVGGAVRVHMGDAREMVPGLGTFDRIIMNHPHGATGFLDVAMAASVEGTVIHLHIIGTRGEAEAALTSARDEARRMGHVGVRMDWMREVRTYAPGVAHLCIDMTVE